MPVEIPDKMTVAAPVSELSPMSRTGLRLVSVKYPVSSWMALASTMPMMHRDDREQPRVPDVVQDRGVGDARQLAELVRQVPERGDRPRSISEMTAETKKPRLMAVMPLRSPLRGATTKMPITAVITPIIGTISGKTSP